MRFLHPWNFPGKSTEVGCHFLLWGIFPTPGSNLGLLHCFYCLSYKPTSLASPALAGGFYTTEPPGKPTVSVWGRGQSSADRWSDGCTTISIYQMPLNGTLKDSYMGPPWQSSGYHSGFPMQGAWVPSLVGELRSHVPCSAARKKK